MTIQSAIRDARKGGKRATRARSVPIDEERIFLEGDSRRNTHIFLSTTTQKSVVTRCREHPRGRERYGKDEKEREATRRHECESEADRRAPPHTRDASYGPPRDDGARKRSFYSERRKIRLFAWAPKWLLRKSRADCTGRIIARFRRSSDT